MGVSYGCLHCLAIAHLVWAYGAFGAAWHDGDPHKPYQPPACPLAPLHGRSDCSSSPSCPLTDHLKLLEAASGFKFPAGNILEGFEHNCTHLVCGCKNDGVGSQMQAKLSTYAFAAAKGMKYVHFPMVRSVGHFSSPQEEERMVKELEQFFNLGQGELTMQEAARQEVKLCAVEHCHVFMDLGGVSCYDDIKASLHAKYDATAKPAPLHAASRISVAVHVRRGDVAVQAGTQDPHYDLRYSPDAYYIDTIRTIKRSLPDKNLDIVILSEGKIEDFDAIMDAHPTSRLVLAGDLLQVLHTMVTADILVTAHSSFSYVAALYNSGIVVYNHFWHPPANSWFKNPWPPEARNGTAGSKTPCRALLQRLKMSSTRNLLEKRWRIRNMHGP